MTYLINKYINLIDQVSKLYYMKKWGFVHRNLRNVYLFYTYYPFHIILLNDFGGYNYYFGIPLHFLGHYLLAGGCCFTAFDTIIMLELIITNI
jgi:hypothetical protein